MREREVEAYLVDCAEQAGGEVRKVQWVGRASAPDRVLMLPHGRRTGPWSSCKTIWVEVKRPGLKATFPADAHERAQHREHQRMRAAGQVVVVVDSFEGVEELLR